MIHIFRNTLLIVLLSTLFVSRGIAHDEGVTDTSITVIKDTITLVYTVPQEHLIEITGDEAKAESTRSAIEAVQKGFELLGNGIACELTSSATRNLSEVNSKQFAYLHKCDSQIRQLQVSYKHLFENDTSHKNYARVSFSGITKNITFSAENRTLNLDSDSIAQKQADKEQRPFSLLKNITAGSNYFPIGVEHILFGPDHLLFLAALLLLPLRLRHILALITTFTIAHSITLGLSVMDILVLKPSFVEFVIALSIVIMAAESIYLLRRQPSGRSSRHLSGNIVYKRIAMTALFGLIHGFGFSFFLREIGLSEQIFSSLLFFNLGVEAGQLLAMIVFLPIIIYLFKRFASTLWAQVLALVIGIIGLIWLVERSYALVAS